MLFFFEIKKLIKNKTVFGIALLLLALTAAFAVRSAASVTRQYVDAEETAKTYADLTSAAERAASTAARAARGEYAVSYYSEVIERYSSAREKIAFKSGDVSGWDELLCFDMPFFAGLLVSVMLGAVSFYEDRRKGASQIINASKNGKRVLASCRVLSSVFLSLVFGLLSAAVSYACFSLMGLLNNGGFTLQSAPSFFNSAENISLSKTFILLTLRRCLILAAVTSGACLVSKLLSGYIPILLVSSAFTALEFVLFSVRYNAVDVFAKNANIFACGSGYLFKRFYCVRFFGKAHPETIVMITALVAIVLFAALATILEGNKKSGGIRRTKLAFKLSVPRPKARPHGLFTWEFIKLLRAPTIFIPLCLCMLIGIAGILRGAPVSKSKGETLYRGYCEEYAGRPIHEVLDMIAEEETRIDYGINRMDGADALYDSGKISFEEYDAICKEYMDCLVCQGQLPIIKARAEYLEAAASEFNSDMAFIYDTGCNKLFNTDVNFLCVFAVILLACCPFYKERECGAIAVICSYRNGRSRLFFTRLAFVLICTFAIMLLFASAELYALSGDGISDALGSPAASIELLHDFGTVSIGSVLAQAYLMRILAAFCAALITFALSTRLESVFPVIASTAGWALISFALRRLNMSFPPTDISAFLSGNAALVSTGPTTWLHVLPFAAVAAFTTAYSYKRYISSGRRL